MIGATSTLWRKVKDWAECGQSRRIFRQTDDYRRRTEDSALYARSMTSPQIRLKGVMFIVPLTAVCLATAAHAYRLPETYLYAILKTEGGHVGQMVHNTNGTDDLGPFQINSAWGPAMGRYWHISVPRAIERVRDDGCANAMIASAILKKMVIETKGDFPKALGFYHSHTKAISATYRDAVLDAAKKIVKGRASNESSGLINKPLPSYKTSSVIEPRYKR
jgi:hypothetical protein